MTIPRLTVRARLTLLYTGLFAACGALVVAITYALVAGLPPGTPTVTAHEAAQLRTFAVCMRTHGIQMSDPDPTGNMRLGGRLANATTRAQLNADPGFKAAYQACKDKLPAEKHQK